jgi:hypothetical protein
MQPRVGESCCSATLHLVLSSKPLAEPMPRMAVNGSISRADRPKTEVVRPTQKLPVQFRHPVLDCRPQPSPAGQLVDLGLEAIDLLRRRLRTDVRSTRPLRVTQPDRVTQEVHALLGHLAETRFGLLHRQPQLRHHRSHHPHRLVGGAPATDHESSGPGGFHPQALSDPDGRLSPHPALMVQSPAVSRSARGPAGSGHVAPPDPTSGLRWWSDASTVCISSAPIGPGHAPDA